MAGRPLLSSHSSYRSLSTEAQEVKLDLEVNDLKDPSLFCQKALINGEWCEADNGKIVEVYNPATGRVIGTCPHMGQPETQRAIEAAHAALPKWRATPAKKRAAVLKEWHRLMMENQKDLAAIMTAEQGKPLAEAAGEIAYAASFLEVYAEQATRVLGEILPPPDENTRIYVHREAVGVVGAITPWNFPAAMITRKCGAAIAAGCPVVIKPSEMTPYSAFALAYLAERAGLPKGVLNVVTGDSSEIGAELTANPIVKKIGFTGSTRVGKILMKQAADTVKRVTLELGGNAPFIVFNDADLNGAVSGLMACKFRNNGQTCVTANRIFVQSEVYDSFCAALVAAVGRLRVGNGFVDGVHAGPLINTNALEKVERQVSDAESKGGRVLVGGRRAKDEHGTQLLFEPTVIADAHKAMTAFSEETFGPLAPIFKFETEEEVVALANDTTAGLAAYFYTSDMGRIHRLQAQLEYGMVAVNAPSVSQPSAPFGGVKESGFGREGSHHGLDDYLSMKTVHINVASTSLP